MNNPTSISDNPRIGIVGAGNVAWHLADALAVAGLNITVCASKGGESAKKLAETFDALYADDCSDFPIDLDFIIIATSDSAVADVAARLPLTDAIVCHTSGSVPLSVLSERHSHSAVIYPLQSFSKEVEVDMKRVPTFIEASDEVSYQSVKRLAQMLTDKVYDADSATRARLHVAGVLAGNFPVYLLEMTRKVLNEVNLPLDVIKPLLEATIDKAFAVGPINALTGPARRGDIQTVEKQSAAFDSADDSLIYRTVSDAILKRFNHI